MVPDRSKCVILVPISSRLEPETDASLRILVDRGYKAQTLCGSSQVDLARSSLASWALAEGFAETIWIDSDIAFDPDDVDRIRELDLPFVAGLYVQKGPKRFAAKFKDGTGNVCFGIGGSVIEMQSVGMGFTFIRSEVYEAVGEAFPICNGGYEGKPVTPFFLPMIDQQGEE